MKKITGLVVLAACFAAGNTVAQEKNDKEINPLSLRPINTNDVMYKTTVWRRIDLREKINQPMFAKGSEITKHLLDGVQAGVLDAYSNDSLTHKLTLDQFNERLSVQSLGGGLSDSEIAAGFGTEDDDGWGGGGTAKTSGGADDGWGDGGSSTAADGTKQATTKTATAASGGYKLFPSELYLIELREDWIFDKQRSRQYNDIQTITIMIPSDVSPDGLEKELASFKYKDLELFFRSNPNCIWFNTANAAQHKNLADAFELRLFQGRIIRVSDPRNRYLEDIYKSPKAGLLKSQELEFELMEKEHNLWEY